MSTPPSPTAVPGNAALGEVKSVTPSAPPPPLLPPLPDLFVAGKEFHLKEYDSLKKEISELVEHSRKLEIYAVGGIAAFYAWFASQAVKPDHNALFIPVLLAALGAFRSWSVLTRLYEIADYLMQVEEVLSLKKPRLTGWETHRKRGSSSPFLSSAAVFWLALFVVTFLAAKLL